MLLNLVLVLTFSVCADAKPWDYGNYTFEKFMDEFHVNYSSNDIEFHRGIFYD